MAGTLLKEIDGRDLLSYVERIEALEKRKRELGADVSAIVKQAVGAGYDGRFVRLCVKARRMKPSEFRTYEDIRKLYFAAAALDRVPPLFQQIEAIAREGFGRDNLMERIGDLVPRGGAITFEVGEGLPVRLARDGTGALTQREVLPDPPAAGDDEADPKARFTVLSGGADPKEAVPAATADQAEEMGGRAFRDDKPITDNPFLFGSEKRRRWDKGWNAAAGEDRADDDDDKDDDAGD